MSTFLRRRPRRQAESRSTRRAGAVPPISAGRDRRRWWRNLGGRPRWSPDLRRRRLRARESFTRYGLTLIVAIGGSSASFVLGTREAIIQLQNELASFQARTSDRFAAQQREIERISSYFGVPPPLNRGK